MNQEGSIKFECFWETTGPVINEKLRNEMNSWRDVLYDLGLIGAYPDGVGYGNIIWGLLNTREFLFIQ